MQLCTSWIGAGQCAQISPRLPGQQHCGHGLGPRAQVPTSLLPARGSEPAPCLDLILVPPGLRPL